MITGQTETSRTKVCICGEDLILKGEKPEAYLQRLGQTVNSHMERLRGLHPNLVRHRLAILTAIHLADELETLKRENAELLQALEEAR